MAIVLAWVLVHGGESAAQNAPSPPGTGLLLSGLVTTLPDSQQKDSYASIPGGSTGDADLFLSRSNVARPDVVLPVISETAGLASRIIAAEGGPGANSVSSAAGFGQFLRGTWLDMFARTYPQLAQKLSSDQILALREVKPLALELTSRYAQENASSLRRVGLPPTEASLSLAHAVGPGGAINILISPHDEPVEKVLSPKAITANPFMKEMTAGSLQRWAMNRVRSPIEAPQAKRAASRPEDEVEPLRPSEDFRIDGHTKASQVLAENRKAIAGLQNLLDATSKIGAGSAAQLGSSTVAWLHSAGINASQLLITDPDAVRIFNKAAAELVLSTIRNVASRAAYRELKSIESNAGRGGLQPKVNLSIASSLVEKMRRETATILMIVKHRRSAATGRLDAAREKHDQPLTRMTPIPVDIATD